MKFSAPIALAFAVALSSAAAAPIRDGPATAELIADVEAIAPGVPFTAALRLVLDPPWHAYWTNPGDSGLPPSLSWSLPEGFAVGDLQFPLPETIPTPPFVAYGHKGSVLLLATVTPPLQIADTAVVLSAEAEWLACDDACVPGFAQLELVLPVRQGPPAPHPLHAPAIDAARALLPATPPDDWSFSAERRFDTYLLDVAMPPSAPPVSSASFFPYSPEAIQHAAPQAFRATPNGFQLQLVPAGAIPPALAGILVLEPGSSPRPFEIAPPISKPVQPSPTTQKGTPP
jgi:DsbC/DsbD-like thiol-disulfide interchange protein